MIFVLLAIIVVVMCQISAIGHLRKANTATTLLLSNFYKFNESQQQLFDLMYTEMGYPTNIEAINKMITSIEVKTTVLHDHMSYHLMYCEKT